MQHTRESYRDRLCPTTRDNVLSPVRSAMITRFIVYYKFGVGEFLARELRDLTVESEKTLLVYPFMIIQLCLVRCRNSWVLMR